jgi:hypothetical protein
MLGYGVGSVDASARVILLPFNDRTVEEAAVNLSGSKLVSVRKRFVSLATCLN